MVSKPNYISLGYLKSRQRALRSFTKNPPINVRKPSGPTDIHPSRKQKKRDVPRVRHINIPAKLVIQSWASDLIAGDYNPGSDVFELSVFSMPGIGVTNTTPVFVSTIGLSGNPIADQTPAISWPYTSGQTFTIQYKDDLTDPVWHNLASSININGNTATVSDSTSITGRRFYRIVQN